jgi:ADP-ribose pyrophosphatase
VIVPFFTSKKLVILRQFRPVIRRYLYEFPAGTLKPGEPTLDCAHRELLEETGYLAQKMMKLGKIFPVPGYSTEVMTILKAEGLRVFRETPLEKEKSPMGSLQKDPDEILETCILSRGQIRRLFRQGRLQDAKTICALGFCGII